MNKEYDAPVLSRAGVNRFRSELLAWGEHHRRSYFWRYATLHPFELLVVEVLLARTRADAAEGVAIEFLNRYGTAEALAEADLLELEEVLRPLGLFRKRARALTGMAKALRDHHAGEVPTELNGLLALPYVGRYAANAFLCFHQRARVAVVDSNVIRVFTRFFGLAKPVGKAESAEGFWALAKRLVPPRSPDLFNWTLLDLGATVCTPKNKKCNECPLSYACSERTREREVVGIGETM